MSRKAEKKTSVLQQAVRSLRRIAMAAEDGELLGSEEELVERLQVSRPTLRQAAALVVQEHLIKVKRGVNGGYFATLPSSSMVTRMAGIYLQSQHASLNELLEAVEPLRGEIARLAAANTDKEILAELGGFVLNEEEGEDQSADYHSFLREERKFGRVLGQLSGNRVLKLLLQIVYDLAARVNPEEDVYLNHPERIKLYRKSRNRMVQAILEGDEELAVLMSRRCSRYVAQWVREDWAGRGLENQTISSVANL